jgi:hypothetical protein
VPIEDYDMWLRIAAEHEIDYIDLPLVKYRDHVSSFRRDKVVTVTHIIDVLNRALSEYPFLKDSLGKKADRRLSCFYVILGKAYLSKTLLKKAFHNFHTAFKLTGSPLLLFYIIFSFIFESFTDILRQARKEFAI